MASAQVLRGHHAEIDPGALGIGLEAFVAIRMLKHSREVFGALHG